jgi:hypothetical protein
MDVQLKTSAGVSMFAMDEARRLWHCEQRIPQADFPLIHHANGRRYELYSDGTFADVERAPGE